MNLNSVNPTVAKILFVCGDTKEQSKMSVTVLLPVVGATWWFSGSSPALVLQGMVFLEQIRVS